MTRRPICSWRRVASTFMATSTIPRGRSPGKQGREQLPGRFDDAQRSQHGAEGNAGHSHHPARRDPAEQVTRGGHGHDGAHRGTEQGQTKRAVGQTQMCLHGGDPRRPDPGHQTEQKENDDDRHVLPASLRKGRDLQRECGTPPGRRLPSHPLDGESHRFEPVGRARGRVGDQPIETDREQT